MTPAMEDDTPEWESFDEADSEMFGLSGPERTAAFVAWWTADEHVNQLTVDELRQLFASFWTNAELPYRYHDEVLSMLGWLHPVTDNDDELNGELTIYRGVSGIGSAEGIAWTLDIDKARWFARRLVLVNRNPRLYRATVHADDVLGYFTGRGESEVLVDPAHLRNVELIEVPDELPE
jgi:hypothetical protein